ncbi:polysialyltransferase family glycosyltransferase [Providencia alcalifaciens]|uniref:polysialyltransferase family glycosyltransferase n=1 Tax=unclassified Providencia TaxID=2633465 RepID=UPI00234A424A|nr:MULTISPECIES: polysialyltransferase family glycosyltransferase [unclassified Providencia]
MSKLIIENTYRSLLMFILKNKQWREYDYILINGRMSLDFIKKFKLIVNQCNIEKNFPVISFKKPLRSLINRYFFIQKIKKYDALYGNVFELKLKDNYNLDVVQIDDGLMTEKLLTGSYKDEIKLSKIRRNLLFKFLFNINYDINLTKYRYLLTKEYEVFNLNYNCEYVDIFKEINDLSERDYLLICELFGYESFIFNNKCIMFLQPFFEDGLVSSLDYEISIYKHILKCEKISEKDIIIKPHPRSNIDYSFYFPEAGWIPKDFPYELLLRLKNERFDKVISVYSSGVKEFSLISNEVVNFGTKDFPELPYMSMIRKKAKDND